MKLRKSLVALLLAVMLMVSPLTAFAEEVTKTDDIVIIYTNDVHCKVDAADGNGGYSQIAALKKQMAEENAAAILVDAGDYIQGDTLGTLTKGEAIVEIMNAAGYEYTTLGNHEFDYGMDQLKYLMNDVAEFKVLSANFTTTDGTAVFDDYEIKEVAGKKIAFVGITTPEALTKSAPTNFQNDKGEYIYNFSNDDVAGAVQKAIDAAVAEGAEYVIAIAHLGIEGTTDGWKSTDIIPLLTGLDVMLDGHSHETIEGKIVKDKEGNDVILTSTGTKVANVGKLVIKNDGTITTELIAAADLPEGDSEVQAVIDAETKSFEALLNQVVATTEITLTIKDADGNRLVRKDDTNLGNLCADAYRTLLEADVAFVNGGGVRADIDEGEITYAEIIAVHPFGNEACLIEATGHEIWQALEMGANMLPGENGGFLQVSGITYEVNLNIPTGVIIDSNGNFDGTTYEYGTSSRVQNIMLVKDGVSTPLDMEETYLLASHNFMLKQGGDGFSMFPDNKLLKDGVLIDNRVLIDYIVNELEGVVTAEAYGEAKDRAIIIPAEETEEPDTPVVPDTPVEPETPEHDNPATGDNAFVFVIFGIAAVSTAVVIDRKRKSA